VILKKERIEVWYELFLSNNQPLTQGIFQINYKNDSNKSSALKNMVINGLIAKMWSITLMKEFDNALEAGYGIELLWDADYVVFKIEGWTDHFAEIVLELFSAY